MTQLKWQAFYLTSNRAFSSGLQLSLIFIMYSQEDLSEQEQMMYFIYQEFQYLMLNWKFENLRQYK